ncbi:OmpA family protein [Enhygromyxa salina]|uniref:OmpA family protein n=1 Tax=Enhygromyxa salina TaxID=215803 RepID=A0A2S9YF77_9BACT|nr:OmpA family protein [Enhygromyxa salina]PRQ03676.1 OmpA family protein [Enhygromyxa salina]
MTRLAPTILLLAGLAQAVACSRVTTVAPEEPIQIQARPPAAPRPGLPAVPQPPPPSRVTASGDLLSLDEALTFDEEGELSSEHQDILAELARWLATNTEVVELTVEVHSIGAGSRRAHTKRSQALATQIVDALVAAGVDAERLVAASVGASEDGQRDVVLRITARAEAAAVEE